MVSTNGTVYVSGRTDKWLLVSYQTDSGYYRAGYIEISQIKGKVPDSAYLRLANTKAMISEKCTLTDDPVYGSEKIANLAAGTEVTYLATLDNLAYVETTVNKQTARGFVPRRAIVIQLGPQASLESAAASSWIKNSKDPGAYEAWSVLDGKHETSWIRTGCPRSIWIFILQNPTM